ncbi:hypothetical protein SDC9_159289 [bioreactor metagenome]|uniref:Uncharacterized protein n=1 Tax=bioreactor metagenome TaxID=1076179 RepID=A0A645FDD7_9ZZZZ
MGGHRVEPGTAHRDNCIEKLVRNHEMRGFNRQTVDFAVYFQAFAFRLVVVFNVKRVDFVQNRLFGRVIGGSQPGGALGHQVFHKVGGAFKFGWVVDKTDVENYRIGYFFTRIVGQHQHRCPVIEQITASRQRIVRLRRKNQGRGRRRKRQQPR